MFDRVYTGRIPDITDMYPEGFGGPYLSPEEEKWIDRMAENKRRFEQARKDGNLVTFADDCVGCKDYEEIGCTHQSDYDVDDVEHGICHNMECKDCPYRKGRV